MQSEQLKQEELKNLIKTEIAQALTVQEQTQTELTKTKLELSETENKLAETTSSLEQAQNTIEQLQKQPSQDSLLANPSKVISLSEHISILESLLPAPMVEKSTLGMQRECQTIRSAIFQANEKLKET